MTPQGIQWQQFFSDPSQWWDNKETKKPPGHPDSRHNKRWPPGSVTTLLQRRVEPNGSDLDIGTCRKLCENGQVTEAVDVLDLLVQRGYHIPNNLYYRVLKSCIGQKNLVLGRRLHALTVTSGYESNAFLANHLICMYAYHGSLVEAMQVFNKVSAPDAYMWASIILAYARHGKPAQAIALHRQMHESTVEPDNHVFVAVLKACASAGDLAAGKDVHARICASAVKPDIFVQTCLVDMYVKCGSLGDARELFDSLPRKDVVTWNAMIAGYTQKGMGHEALSLYSGMQHEDITPPDAVTFVSLLQACASVGVAAVNQGKQLHAHIEDRELQNDVVISASLIYMYSKCGRLEDACRVFESLSQKTVVAWNAMIAGYAQQGMGHEALGLYGSMHQEGITPPNSATFVCLLRACARIGVGALHEGKQLQVHIEEQGLQDDVAVGNSLINMYAKCGSLRDARRQFDRLPDRNVVTWTAMIAGYAQQGMGQEALSLYSSMQHEGIAPPDSVAFVCLLQACGSVGAAALHQGKQLHARIEQLGVEADVVVGASVVNMYVKCGSLEDAETMFGRLPQKDVVTWTAMIAGYSQQGLGEKALSLYTSMQEEGITPPNSVTFICLLQACASLAALPLGKQLHSQIEERGLQANVGVGPSLVNMYAKCGSLADAQQVFDSLFGRDAVTWNALIAGYARQGDSEAVFNLVDRMRHDDGIEPDGITFLSVLTVCSYVGLVDKGRKYFEAMRTECGISANIAHYTCMVDLLGRSGQLDGALLLVSTMPFQPDVTVWLTLLGACRKWRNVEVGRQAFESAVKVDEKDAAAYVLMSNIYAGAQMWEEAKAMQARRVKCGAWKEPGRSWWTDMSGRVHSFVAGDRKHPESPGIYARLERLILKLKKQGYVQHLESCLRDIPDDEKGAELCAHSEKLAIAYALNKTPDGTTIRIVKNLRVCIDCHQATAYISEVEKRTIICRDASRFHVYKDGKCSCGDYW